VESTILKGKFLVKNGEFIKQRGKKIKREF